MKLISMTEFVLEQEKELINAPINEEGVKQLKKYITLTSAYANFLKQPLTLGMFVPCDEDGNVLEEPEYTTTKYGCLPNGTERFATDKEQYQQAKERVLFEGFEIVTPERVKHHEKSFHFSHKRVEQIISRYGDVIQLAPTALKQIGL